MGLAEKRAAKEFEEKRFPELKKRIEEAAGYAVQMYVDWDSIAVDDSAHLYGDAWTKVYFEPLIQAIKAICVDDLGKESLRMALKKINVKNTAGNYSGTKIARFDGGALSLDHEPCSNIDQVKQRAEAIQKCLEEKL